MIEAILNPKTDLLNSLANLMDLVTEKDATKLVRNFALSKNICPECWEYMVQIERPDGSAYLECKYCELRREVY